MRFFHFFWNVRTTVMASSLELFEWCESISFFCTRIMLEAIANNIILDSQMKIMNFNRYFTIDVDLQKKKH